jgi:cytochrome c oxidase subunit 1
VSLATVPPPMTSTETAPAAPAGLLATADHKRLGLLFIAGALLFLLVGGVLGVVLRGELAETGNLLGDEYPRLFSLHATVGVLLGLGPLWVGLATYLVPLQLGASRLALPRLHALSLWLFLVGGGLVIAAYVMGPPSGLGLSTATPMGAPEGGAETEVVLWVVGLVLVGLAAVLAAVSLAVTVLTMRTPGMTVSRVPLFSFASFATSIAVVIATPVFLAGLVLLYVDQHYGGAFFGPDHGVTQAVWQHTLWLFGRPEVYLLLLPGLGAACDIVSTHARRPLLVYPAAQGALALFAAIPFLAWAAGTDVKDAVVLPTYTPLTALIALPVGILALLWLGTLAFGSPRIHISLAFVVGFLGLAAFGAVNAAVAAFAEVDGNTAWTTAHVHVLVVGAPLLLAVAALYHWAPKMWGQSLSAGLGGIVFLALFGGVFLNGLGTYLLGYDGAPAHVAEYADGVQLNYSRLAAAGGVLVGLGVLLLVADVARVASAARRAEAAEADPYEGLTLEWAAASPPPPANFTAVPEVRSAQPLHDLRAAAGAGAPS